MRRLFVEDSGPPIGDMLFEQLASPDERSEILALIFADAVVAADFAIDGLQRIEPPAEFAADHGRLIQVLEELRARNAGSQAQAEAGELDRITSVAQKAPAAQTSSAAPSRISPRPIC